MIEIQNVSKYYKQVSALNNVSLTITSGKIYGLLGRNGAGKSTLLRILANRIFASEGRVYIDDETASENANIRDKIYCMSEENLYPNMKVKEIFHWTSQFYDSFNINKAY